MSEDAGSNNDAANPATGSTDASLAGRVVTGEEAERLYALFTRPARKPTPAMQKAIENYKRLKAAQCSSR